MKKIVLILCSITIAALAYSPLDSQDIRGTKTYCYYVDGSVVVVDAGDSCPMSN